MKKTTIVLGLAAMFGFISCGPASENREAMHVRAKAFQDSIAFIIKSSMDEAAAPGPGQAVRVDTSRKMTAPPSPTAK